MSGYNKKETWKSDESDYFSHIMVEFGDGLAGKEHGLTMTLTWNPPDFLQKNKPINLLGEKQVKIRSHQFVNYTNSTWDYQRGFARHLNSGMLCVPSKSLIENIGFGENATHTQVNTEKNVQRYEINFPLKPNNYIVVDKDYDDSFFRKVTLFEK